MLVGSHSPQLTSPVLFPAAGAVPLTTTATSRPPSPPPPPPAPAPRATFSRCPAPTGPFSVSDLCPTTCSLRALRLRAVPCAWRLLTCAAGRRCESRLGRVPIDGGRGRLTKARWQPSRSWQPSRTLAAGPLIAQARSNIQRQELAECEWRPQCAEFGAMCCFERVSLHPGETVSLHPGDPTTTSVRPPKEGSSKVQTMNRCKAA